MYHLFGTFILITYICHMKKYYYIFWVEGLSLKSGEKVKTLTDTGVDYTTQMTESLRVKPNDLGSVEAYMKRHGITYTTHKTSYAPKGTILNLKRIAI